MLILVPGEEEKTSSKERKDSKRWTGQWNILCSSLWPYFRGRWSKGMYSMQVEYQARSAKKQCHVQYSAQVGKQWLLNLSTSLLTFLLNLFIFVCTCFRMTELKNPPQKRNLKRTIKRTKRNRSLQRKKRRGTRGKNGQSLKKKRWKALFLCLP